MEGKDIPYRIGDVVQGEITGIKPYGVFVKLDDNSQGLIHISEADHGFIEDLSESFKVGTNIDVKIIDIDEHTNKMSLSVRALNSLSIPNHPSKRHRPKRRRTPAIGFQTLEEMMADWIDEGLGKINRRSGRDENNEPY